MTIKVKKDSIIGIPRKESGSFYLITPKIHPKPHFVNSYIFNLWKDIDGESIDSIIKKYIEKYPEVDKGKIREDILSSIIYLNNLKMIDISGEEEEIYNMKEIGISIVNESDFREVNEFILNSYNSSEGVFVNFTYGGLLEANLIKEIYSIQRMRINQIHGKELYFKMYDDEKNLNWVIGISLLNKSKSCYINTIIIGGKYHLDFGEVMVKLMDYLRGHGIECFKIKTSENEYVNKLIDIGFLIEAELKDELESQKSLYVIRRG